MTLYLWNYFYSFITEKYYSSFFQLLLPRPTLPYKIQNTINIVQESILYCRRRRHLNGNFLYGKEVILSVLTFLALKKCKINVLPYLTAADYLCLKPRWLGFLIILLFILQVHSLTARSVSREFRENLKADKPKVTDTIGKLLYF